MGECGVKKTKRLPPERILPLQTATLEELVARLEEQAEAVTTINAVTELVPTTGSAYSGVIEQYHDVRAFVLARRRAGNAGDPGAASGPRQQIRLIGQAPVVRKNIFDMVADEETFHIFIPPRNKFIEGRNNLTRRSKKPIENLRPQHLFEAVFPAAPWPNTPHLLEENEFAGQRYYAVSEIVLADSGRMTLHRKWWFERSRLELVRVQRFDSEGHLIADVHYGDWRETAGGVPYPYEIELVRPQEDYRLKLLIKELTLNQPIEEKKFHLERPAGVELVRLVEEPEAEPEVVPEEPR